jgi:hypothetical protein
MIKRNSKGQFIKDFHYSPTTEIKKGQHLSSKTEFKKGFKHTDKHKKYMSKIAKERGFGLWMKGRKGELNPSWKGGKYAKSDGYILVYQPDYPSVKNNGYVRQSRLVAEKCLGRYLTSQEVIHHINEVKDDDRPKNLYLFPFNSKHQKFHHLKNKPKLKSNLSSIF